jgi:ribonuclease J
LGHSTSGEAFKKICGDGVLAYVGDSTNAQKEGSSPSEEHVRKGLVNIFKRQEKRIVVTTFSSNVGRLYSIAKAAEAVGRSVVVVGRSMDNMIGAAKKCGYLSDLQPFLSAKDFKKLPRENVVLITTGSQGEPRAGLSRIAQGDHRDIRLEKGDTVIFSSWKIPGNEKEINALQNSFVAGGLNVITNNNCGEDMVHVSGHPCQEDLKSMLSWAKPHIAIPVHGERIMVEAHGRLAESEGIEHVIVPQNGSVICLDPKNPRIIDHIETSFLGVEPRRVIPLNSRAISARRKLQYTGVVFVSLLINDKNKLLDDPQIDLIGLEDPDSTSEGKALDDVFGEIETTLLDTDHSDLGDIEEELRIMVKRMLTQRYGFKPNVVVHAYRG